MRKVIIGVMGPGRGATELDIEAAFDLGVAIAESGHILLTGGRKEGVMDAAAKGAKSKGGLTMGILPGTNTDGMSDAVDIPVLTGMHNARNNINVLSSKVVIACGLGAGTLSEIMLAVKSGIPIILLCTNELTKKFLNELSGPSIIHVNTVEAAMKELEELL